MGLAYDYLVYFDVHSARLHDFLSFFSALQRWKRAFSIHDFSIAVCLSFPIPISHAYIFDAPCKIDGLLTQVVKCVSLPLPLTVLVLRLHFDLH